MARLPPHELREQWMTAISASFHQATVWRFVRDEQARMEMLRNKLEVGIMKLTGVLEELWLGPRVIAFWQQILDRLRRLQDISRRIISWLEERGWRNSKHRDEKELVIKMLVVLAHHVALSQRIVKGSMGDLVDCFRRHQPVRAMEGPRKRWSFDNRDQYHATLLENRCNYERVLLLYAQKIEQRLKIADLTAHELYDSGALFERFVSEVQHRKKVEEERYSRFNYRYPYPACRLKDISDRKGTLWKNNSPTTSVPIWDEDEDLKALFPYEAAQAV